MNKEKYSDPTAEQAIGKVMREEKRKRQREEQNRFRIVERKKQIRNVMY